MLRYFSSLMGFLGTHWVKLIVLNVVIVLTIVVAFSPPLQAKASAYWDKALMWAGFVEVESDSGTIYWCPMHPQIKRKKANEVCPICNMALVPLEGGQVEAPTSLTLTPRQIQQGGVAYEPVIRRRLYREIDTTGRIASDERREAKITSWVRGKSRIEKLHIDFTGQRVEQGALMAELYSPALIVAQQEYLTALKGPGVPGIDLPESSRQKLRDQGMTAEQIDELARTKKVLNRISIYAPIGGTVMHRYVNEGQYVSEGEMLFHISDLSQLWLFADIYEEELSLVEEGQLATITVRSFAGDAFQGTVSFIDPMVKSDSRTIPVRVEVENPDRRLKPGMYARVRLRRELGEMLAVPANAVLWSGERQVAIVKQGEGTFQPREIEIDTTWLYSEQPTRSPTAGGLEFGSDSMRYHALNAGLSPGEQVVTAGAFLLNAESQFQSVLTKMLPPETERASLEEAVGAQVASRIRRVLDDYYGLSLTLAEDRLESVPQQASKLTESATDLAQKADAENRSELSGQAERLAELARKLTTEKPEDLHQARIEFGRISRMTVTLLSENGGQTLFGEDMFLFRCGMAKVGYENWLWWSPEKHNPYMGQKMLNCGSQLKTLEP